MPIISPNHRAFKFFFCAILLLIGTPAFAFETQDSLTDLQTRSAHGDKEAQNLLGVKYFSGDGVYEDKEKAAELFTKAARQGQIKAQFNLGYMYHNGLGIPQDYMQACIWYKAAANQGHPEAGEYYESLRPYLSKEKLDEIDRLSNQFSSHHELTNRKNQTTYSRNPSQSKNWIRSIQPAAGR